jgi:hypothetical protein
VRLAGEDASLERCSALLEVEHAERRAKLIELLLEAGYDVPGDWL